MSKSSATSQAIPREVAIKLCDEIRSENKRRWFSIWRTMCHFCYKFSKGDVAKMCLSSTNGCFLVNKRYELYQEGK